MVPPWAQSALDRLGAGDFAALRDRLITGLQQASQIIATRALNIGQNAVRLFVGAEIMLYVLFFLFRDGRQIARNIGAAMRSATPPQPAAARPLHRGGAGHGKGLHPRRRLPGRPRRPGLLAARDPGRAALGRADGLLFALPAVGAALVWLPVAGYLILTGAIERGVVLIVFGMLVIGLVDNLLRPVLVGKDTRMPDYVVLVSTLGSISVAGINGFVIGPMIAAMFIAAWTLFHNWKAARRRLPEIPRRPPDLPGRFASAAAAVYGEAE